MKKIVVLLVVLWWASIMLACKPKVVYVTVPCPKPPVVQRPALPIKELKPEASQNEERKLWQATVDALIGYAEELETLLDGYRQ